MEVNPSDKEIMFEELNSLQFPSHYRTPTRNWGTRLLLEIISSNLLNEITHGNIIRHAPFHDAWNRWGQAREWLCTRRQETLPTTPNTSTCLSWYTRFTRLVTATVPRRFCLLYEVGSIAITDESQLNKVGVEGNRRLVYSVFCLEALNGRGSSHN